MTDPYARDPYVDWDLTETLLALQRMSAEDLLSRLRERSMRPDETLDAIGRRGLYAAYRRIETITPEEGLL